MKNELFHERLERLRGDRKLTAKAMAQSIDVAESTYREWEKGRGMKLPPFQKISHVLAISVTELITGEKPNWAEIIGQLVKIEKSMTELRLSLSSRI